MNLIVHAFVHSSTTDTLDLGQPFLFQSRNYSFIIHYKNKDFNFKTHINCFAERFYIFCLRCSKFQKRHIITSGPTAKSEIPP